MTALTDRTAIVTGASTGIGRAIAEAFARAGANVVLAARTAGPLEKTCEEMRAEGLSVLGVPTDVTSEAEVDALFERAVATFGGVDIVVNNAGVSVTAAPDELDLADWKRVIDTNVTGAFLCTSRAMRLMKAKGGGRILNIGSVSARAPRPGSIAYTTSKFAIDGMTRAAALDGRAHGIAVSVIHPGNIETALWTGREDLARSEGIMNPAEVARIALLTVTLPADMNMLETFVLPVTMPFIGRG